jgi:hypothetical protein
MFKVMRVKTIRVGIEGQPMEAFNTEAEARSYVQQRMKDIEIKMSKLQQNLTALRGCLVDLSTEVES